MTQQMEYRNGYADVDFGQIHYTARHNPSGADGTVLVLLNPRARSSLPLLPLFPDVERVIGIDLPGFGRSSPVPDGPSMRDVAHAVIGCMDVLGIKRADLFGLHTGHKVAAALAAHWPARVDRLIIAGRSHSLIPDHAQRNKAMQAVIDENQVDMAIIRMEGRYADETWGPRAFAELFKANFEFDFADAMRSIATHTMIIEITSDREDQLYGRQASKLTAGMANARAIALPQTDPTGLSMYVGFDLLAGTIKEFLASAPSGLT